MNNITDIFKKLLKQLRSGGVHKFQLINPVREWVIGLSVAALLLVGGGYYAGNLFLEEVEKDVFDVRAEGAGTAVYKRVLIRDVLERYDARAEAFSELDVGVVPTSTSSPQTDADTATTDDVAPAQ